MQNKLPLFGWVIMLLTSLTCSAAEKTASGSFVTVRAEAQELERVGDEWLLESGELTEKTKHVLPLFKPERCS